MADSYHGTDNFTAPSEESHALEFDTTQSTEEEEDNDVTQSMEEEEEEDNDVTQMGKEIVEYKSIPSKSGRRKRRRLSSEDWEVSVKLPRSSDGRERNKCKLCGKVYLCESILATVLRYEDVGERGWLQREQKLWEKNSFSMEESTNKKKSDDNNGRLVVDTSMSDKSMWLIKCPPSLSRSLRDGDDPTRPVAKLLLSIDPLSSSNDEFSSPQEISR